MHEPSGRVVLVGGSIRCADGHGLAVTCRKALIALDVVRQLGRSGSIVYDRAGMVGRLFSLRHEARGFSPSCIWLCTRFASRRAGRTAALSAAGAPRPYVLPSLAPLFGVANIVIPKTIVATSV